MFTLAAAPVQILLVIFRSFMADVNISAKARREYLDHIELESAAQGEDRLRKRFSKPLMALLLRERLVSSLSVAFGLLALALTGIGLYGILAYSVARRTNEIGIRLALGASRAETVWMVLREALLTAAGVVSGTPFVWLLGRA